MKIMIFLQLLNHFPLHLNQRGDESLNGSYHYLPRDSEKFLYSIVGKLSTMSVDTTFFKKKNVNEDFLYSSVISFY